MYTQDSTFYLATMAPYTYTNILVLLLAAVMSMSLRGEVCCGATGKASKGPCREETVRKASQKEVQVCEWLSREQINIDGRHNVK